MIAERYIDLNEAVNTGEFRIVKDADLKKLFHEYVIWCITGKIPQGSTLTIYKKYYEDNKGGCEVMEHHLILECARRFARDDHEKHTKLANIYPNQKENPGLWNGERFWCGAYDTKDRKVKEVHTYEECEAYDFNSEWAFRDEYAEKKFDIEEWLFFWIENGRIYFQKESENGPAERYNRARRDISMQIKILTGEEKYGKDYHNS